MAALAAAIDNGTNGTGDQVYGPASRRAVGSYGGDRWDMSVGWDGAVKLARDGWAEGREMIAPLTGRLIDSLSSRMSFESWIAHDEGEYFEVEDVLSGEPECWRTLRTFEGEGTARRRVQIALSNYASAGIDGEAIAARGAAICALIELLECAGMSVKVDAAYVTGTDSDGFISDTVTLKGYDERVDLGIMAFWAGHPANLRRIGFALSEAHPEELRNSIGVWTPRRGDAGYGRACDAEERFIGYAPDIMIPAPNLYIPGTYDSWTRPEGAEKWIRDWLEKMGVHFHK